jgi:hypothetical protein
LAALLALVLAACASVDAESNATFERGLRQAEAGNVQAAIKTLSAGVVEHSGHLRMRFELARLQYEVGESHHLMERKNMRDSAVFLEQGQRDKALAKRRKANEERAKAGPFYQAARENLRIVADSEEDGRRQAWAAFLLMRTDIFFEDWEEAYYNVQRAIELGRPSGPQLAQMREFQAGIKEKMAKRVRY